MARRFYKLQSHMCRVMGLIYDTCFVVLVHFKNGG
jgi:hypothetical protein